MSTKQDRTVGVGALVEDSDIDLFSPEIHREDEVMGKGAVGVPEYVPTRHELLMLVRYWYKKRLEMRYRWFIYEQVGSDEVQWEVFAGRRLRRIYDLLGEEMVPAVQKLLDDAYEEFGKKEDPLAWRVFDGTATGEEKLEFEQRQERVLNGDFTEDPDVTKTPNP